MAGVYNSNISRLCGFRIQRTIYTAVVPKNILKQKPSILQTGRLGLSKVDLWCNSFLSSGATGPLLWQLDPKIPGNTVPKPGRCHAHTNPQQNWQFSFWSICFPSAEAKNLETTPTIPWKIQWIWSAAPDGRMVAQGPSDPIKILKYVGSASQARPAGLETRSTCETWWNYIKYTWVHIQIRLKYSEPTHQQRNSPKTPSYPHP